MEGDPLGIAAWVESQLPRPPTIVGAPKAIHDPLLGTNLFHPHEIALLDTPLLQRLRYIGQTGLVYLTFPGARHTRLEHTLGTVVLASRYARALRTHGVHIDDQDESELRLAALLHDVGHAFFSHASEAVYGRLPVFDQYKEHVGVKKGAGELLSHAIVTSEPFRSFFADATRSLSPPPRLDRIAGYIIGTSATRERRFLADVISGPFDVDKLEYIHRDAYSTGLRLVVDLERFFYSVSVADVENETRIVLHSPEPLEQLIFSKMMLFASVYHHHKVKACDCLLEGAIDWARRNGAGVLARLERPLDFLSLTDLNVLADQTNPLIERIRNRRLLYRSAVISTESVSSSWKPAIHKLQKVTSSPAEIVSLNSMIYGALPAAVRQNVQLEEIWVNFPDLPTLKELDLAYIARGNGEVVHAQDIIPTRGWLGAYETYKSKGHVFAPQRYVREVYEAAAAILEERCGLQFKQPVVMAVCHWGDG